jgi:hypothetical protein
MACSAVTGMESSFSWMLGLTKLLAKRPNREPPTTCFDFTSFPRWQPPSISIRIHAARAIRRDKSWEARSAAARCGTGECSSAVSGRTRLPVSVGFCRLAEGLMPNGPSSALRARLKLYDSRRRQPIIPPPYVVDQSPPEDTARHAAACSHAWGRICQWETLSRV